LLNERGLTRYYALAGSQVAPVAASTAPRSHAWLEPLLEQAQAQPGEVCQLQLDVQGIHCAACVWLMNETFKKLPGAGGITVNPTLGTVQLSWRRDALDPSDWVRDIEGFGYQFGPPRKEAKRRSSDLPLRLGISAAIAINVMLFSVSFYFGLGEGDPDIFRLFTWLSAALSTGTVVIGGWPFFTAAWRGLRSRMLHLDLPIALGIALVWAMSLVQLGTSGGRGDMAYFDTLNVFITLMLLGRFIQERLLDRNRRYLLEDDGADGLLVRRVQAGAIETVRAPQVGAGDVLLVAPGDLVPAAAVLHDEEAHISTDWMTGEAAPRRIGRGEAVPAGSFNAGRTAFQVTTTERFVDSPLVALLRQMVPRAGRDAKYRQLWHRLARRWVVTVLAVATAGFALWLPRGIDAAVNVAVALLVITCPCAIGIAIPLAYELALSRLRRAGFYVRSDDLLDRLTAVKQVLFDKTGTLTMGRLELVDPDVVRSLDRKALDAAYNLAVRSSHPVSVALARALLPAGPRFDPAATVAEEPGKGVRWDSPDGTWRLGRADWAILGETGRFTALSHDGRAVASLETREVLRADASRQVSLLRALGYGVRLLSGDAPSRVAALAATLGIESSHAEGGLTPEGKAQRVTALGGGEEALYVGDGVNDALAFEAALAAGTPAIDRPVMPGKSDFFLVGEGLSPILTALEQAAHLRRVVRRLLAISLAYNVLAISAALAGLMSPLAAAVSMPASTITLILIAATSMRKRPAAALPEPGARLAVAA
jgi:Cu2+-exporting ATPase